MLVLPESLEYCRLHWLWIVVCVDHFTLRTRQSWGHIFGNSRSWVIALVGGYETLAATSRKVDDEGGHHKARQCSSKLLVQFDDLGQRRSKVLDALYHITLIHVVLGAWSATSLNRFKLFCKKGPHGVVHCRFDRQCTYFAERLKDLQALY